MASKYIDTTAVLQVIGCVYSDVSILDADDTYTITEEDFETDFHKLVFGVMYKLHQTGIRKMSLEAINDFLENLFKSIAMISLSNCIMRFSASAEISSVWLIRYN